MIVVPDAGIGVPAAPSPEAGAIEPGTSVRSVAVPEVVTTGGRVVLYLDGAVHVLNPTAVLIWRSCDEAVTVATLAREFAESFSLGHHAALVDVLGTVRHLVERGLVRSVDAEPAANAGTMLPILQPLPACSGCGEGPTYERHVVVDLGGVGVSIGADAEVADALVAALGSRAAALETVPKERASYGIVAPSGADGRVPVALARLHRGPDVLLTSRDPLRVFRAALAQVVIHAPSPEGVQLEGLAVGRDDRVVVVPFPANRVAFERGAAELGLGVSDASMTVALLDPAHVLVGARDLQVDSKPLEGVASRRRHLSEPARLLPWGRYELSALAVNATPNVASVVGELGPRLGSFPTGRTPLGPLLDLVEVVPLMRGTSPAEIDDVLRTTPPDPR